MIKSGIYQITNIVSKKIYIGSAISLRRRFTEHKRELKKNAHYNRKLQNSYNKHGEGNFKFEVLATCPKEYLIKMEQWFIDKLNPEYNICKKAGSCLGVKHSDATRIKISNSKKGLQIPQSVRDKISIANKGKKRTEETKKKMSVAFSGRKYSDEVKKKMSIIRKESVVQQAIVEKLNISKRKAVYQYALDGRFLVKHDGVRAAAKYIGVSHKAICQVVLGIGNNKTCKGFQFKYFFSQNIEPVAERKRKISIYKGGVFIGAYNSLAECGRDLSIHPTELSQHLNGNKSYSKVGGYTAKEITDDEYKQIKSCA